jgi:hypothetical protein
VISNTLKHLLDLAKYNWNFTESFEPQLFGRRGEARYTLEVFAGVADLRVDFPDGFPIEDVVDAFNLAMKTLREKHA